MKALLELPAPVDTHDSLGNSSDKSEVYIRGLEFLGQNQEMYGSMIIPVMLCKLPTAVKQTRGNRNVDWTLHKLRDLFSRKYPSKRQVLTIPYTVSTRPQVFIPQFEWKKKLRKPHSN